MLAIFFLIFILFIFFVLVLNRHVQNKHTKVFYISTTRGKIWNW